jgi:hypothetical protein
MSTAASAIYRRWPSRVEVIEHAIYDDFLIRAEPPTGHLHRDLSRFVELTTEAFGAPAARAAIPGLLSAYQDSAQTPRPDVRSLAPIVRASFRRLLAAAGPDAVSAEVEPDSVLDLLVGSVVFRTFMLPTTPRAGASDDTVDLLVRAVAPRPASPAVPASAVPT